MEAARFPFPGRPEPVGTTGTSSLWQRNMSKFYDAKLNKILKSVSGKGPYPWSYYRDAYCGRGNQSKRLLQLFARRMMEYADLSPRIVIMRPYNLSESPMIEVLSDVEK